MKHRIPALVSLTVALLAAPLTADADRWVSVGPPGGDVRSLVADPSDPRRLYLGTADGLLYVSDDAGQRWRRSTPGFPMRGYSLDEIVVGPGGFVAVGFWKVAGGTTGGIAISNDEGKTFDLPPGIQGESVRAIAMAPSDARTLVAGSLSGVFRSRDAGGTWQRISPEGHEEIRNVESVAIDPKDPDVVYVGTWHLPWKTTDGGAHWSPIARGMIDDSDVFTMTIDRRDASIVYATACSGIYRSGDAAGRWSRIRGIPSSSRRTRAFAQDPDEPNRLYAGTTEGLWASDDGSATWRQLTVPSLVINAVVSLPGGTVLLGTEGAGVLRSSDRGASWASSNTGFSERLLTSLAFDPERGRLIAAAWGDRNHGGVFVREPGDGGWKRLGTGLQGREVLSVALYGERIVAGTDDGVYMADGVSATWHRLPTVVGGFEVRPRVTDMAVAAGRVLLAATTQHGILRSTDGGMTWSVAPGTTGARIGTVAVAPAKPAVVMAASPIALLRSEDAGASWSVVSGSLPATHRLVFAPDDEKVVYAATGRGLFRSSDAARTWRRMGNGLPSSDITGVALHPNGKTLFASDFTYGGVFRSDDGGVRWRRMTREGLASERVWTVAIDPRSPDRLLAAAAAGGLHEFVPPADTAAAASP